VKKRGVFFLLIALFIFQLSEVEAKESEQEYVIKGEYDENKPGIHSLHLEEDSLVDFSYVDNQNSSGKEDLMISFYKNSSGVATRYLLTDNSKPYGNRNFVYLRKGDYQIKIQRFSGPKYGKYEISYTLTETAVPYEIGETVTSNLFRDNKGRYRFEIPVFGKLQLKFYETEPKYKWFNTMGLEAFTEDNESVFAISSGVKDNTFEVLVQPGVYYFEIDNDYDRENLDYTLSTMFQPLDPMKWESGLNKDRKSPHLIENNKTYNGFLHTSVNKSDLGDYYKFVLKEDSNVGFIVNTSNRNYSALIFMDEEWVQIDPWYAESETNQIIVEDTMAAGTYYINLFKRTIAALGHEDYDITMRIQRFSDVPVFHPYFQQIESLAQLNINRGYPDGSYHPKEGIKRRHVFALLDRVEHLELSPIRQMKVFKDLSESEANYDEIKKFYEAGVIDGGGSFMLPDAVLTRGQLAKILVNTFNLKLQGDAMQFSDVTSENSYYSYIQILASHGITIGYNGKFMPDSTVTREQFSIFLYRILEKS